MVFAFNSPYPTLSRSESSLYGSHVITTGVLNILQNLFKAKYRLNLVNSCVVCLHHWLNASGCPLWQTTKHRKTYTPSLVHCPTFLSVFWGAGKHIDPWHSQERKQKLEFKRWIQLLLRNSSRYRPELIKLTSIRCFQGRRGFVVLCFDLQRRRHSLQKTNLIMTQGKVVARSKNHHMDTKLRTGMRGSKSCRRGKAAKDDRAMRERRPSRTEVGDSRGGKGGTLASQAEWLHVHAWKAPDENEDLISQS